MGDEEEKRECWAAIGREEGLTEGNLAYPLAEGPEDVPRIATLSEVPKDAALRDELTDAPFDI